MQIKAEKINLGENYYWTGKQAISEAEKVDPCYKNKAEKVLVWEIKWILVRWNAICKCIKEQLKKENH